MHAGRSWRPSKPLRRPNHTFDHMRHFILLFITLLGSVLHAQTKPTQANVAYGKHERQVLDFYQAASDKPAPLLFFIHGGGWMNGDKANPDFLNQCLGAGINMATNSVSDSSTGK